MDHGIWIKRSKDEKQISLERPEENRGAPETTN
jgi:hypothetical protein